MCYICTRNKALLVYGVMVTLLFLVQSFKVRVLVDQQKPPYFGRFFCFKIVSVIIIFRVNF
jgi:hypothetical protein